MTTPRGRSPASTARAWVDDRTLDAAPGHGAGDLAGVVHHHRRAGIARAGAVDAHHARDRDASPLGPPPGDVVEDLFHRPTVRSGPGGGRAHDARELGERRDRVALDEVVDERQRRGHARGQRREPRRGLERVDPDDAVRDPGQPRHLLGEHVGLAAVPPVGDDHHDGTPGHAPHPPRVVEGAQRRADARTARPIGDPRRRGGDRGIRIPVRQLASEAGQARAEGERLHTRARDHRAVQEAHQHPRVRLHRAAHVAEHHEPAGPARR